METDHIESFGQSLIQHGPANDRVYLMKLDRADLPDIIDHIHELALRCGYSKIFAKVPAYAKAQFKQGGYRLEAAIPNFYNGKEDGLFMARYYDSERMIDSDFKRVLTVIEKAQEEAAPSPQQKEIRQGLECRVATPLDCPQMSELYRQVFESYPFPIYDPEYLRQTMAENVVYAGIWQDEKLLALSSAEVDKKMANAEMTDFATHPDCRGFGFANVLLHMLEDLVAKTGIKTCYTIARATSFGMNITFARNSYTFAGTLINNTQISGSLESMNIWHKQV
ncbi:MAG: putative beta-lysine N-acetyltransferase [Desulforhopalus sp.]|jgi:putative beta-lysine N-acetyltransferase